MKKLVYDVKVGKKTIKRMSKKHNASRKSYDVLGYSKARKVLANCDKCSSRAQSNVVNSPWGKIKMYKSVVRGGISRRYFSVSGADGLVLTNGGSYRISTLRRKLWAVM